jgi:ribosomal protein L12E/L44/L45/RPP1/RPP2
MKYFLPIVCLLIVFSAQQTVAMKKVTQTVTLTGVSVAQLNAQKSKILAGIAAILGVPADKVVSEGDSIAVTTAAPSSTTAAPVSAAPTTTSARRRRLASITFTYSVIVANQAEADAIKAKIEKNDFATKLVKEVAKATGVSESAIQATPATPAVDNYVPTTTAPAKGVVSSSERNTISFILYACISVCVVLVF